MKHLIKAKDKTQEQMKEHLYGKKHLIKQLGEQSDNQLCQRVLWRFYWQLYNSFSEHLWKKLNEVSN